MQNPRQTKADKRQSKVKTKPKSFSANNSQTKSLSDAQSASSKKTASKINSPDASSLSLKVESGGEEVPHGILIVENSSVRQQSDLNHSPSVKKSVHFDKEQSSEKDIDLSSLHESITALGEELPSQEGNHSQQVEEPLLQVSHRSFHSRPRGKGESRGRRSTEDTSQYERLYDPHSPTHRGPSAPAGDQVHEFKY